MTDTLNESEIYKKLWIKFGEDTQMLKAVEELSELIKAICKKDINAVSEEIADVQIMVEQIVQFYDLSEVVGVYKGVKLRRVQHMLLREGD